MSPIAVLPIYTELSVRTQWLGKAQWELRPVYGSFSSSCLTERLFSTHFFWLLVSLLAYLKWILYSNVKGQCHTDFDCSPFLPRGYEANRLAAECLQILKPAAQQKSLMGTQDQQQLLIHDKEPAISSDCLLVSVSFPSSCISPYIWSIPGSQLTLRGFLISSCSTLGESTTLYHHHHHQRAKPLSFIRS